MQADDRRETTRKNQDIQLEPERKMADDRRQWPRTIVATPDDGISRRTRKKETLIFHVGLYEVETRMM